MLYEQKEIARLRRELRDAQDALDVLKKESPKGKRHHRKREKGKPQQRKYDCFRSDGKKVLDPDVAS